MKLTVTTFLTLDGVMQGPGMPGEDGFDLGGWQVPYVDDAFMGFMLEVFAQVDAFLLGRRTYEIFAAHWPQVTDPDDAIAASLNRLPKHVASRTLQRLEWRGAHLIEGDVAAEVARLKAQPGRELQVHGSGALVQTLMRHDLVDAFRLLVAPVVLGRGKRLFAEGCTPTALQPAESRTTGGGLTILTCRAAGRPAFGSMGLEASDGTTRSTRRA